MSKIIVPPKPQEMPEPAPFPEVNIPDDPQPPVSPLEDPDIIPDEDPFETPPTEIPPPGEAP